jgi:hypothetical protein
MCSVLCEGAGLKLSGGGDHANPHPNQSLAKAGQAAQFRCRQSVSQSVSQVWSWSPSSFCHCHARARPKTSVPRLWGVVAEWTCVIVLYCGTRYVPRTAQQAHVTWPTVPCKPLSAASRLQAQF